MRRAAALDVPEANRRRIFAHFADRLAERVDPHLAPLPIWLDLIRAFHHDDRDRLTFVVRGRDKARRIFMARCEDDLTLFVVIDCDMGLPITVLKDGMSIIGSNGRRICLGANDAFR